MATWSGKVSTNNTAAILLLYFTLMIDKKMFFSLEVQDLNINEFGFLDTSLVLIQYSW